MRKIKIKYPGNRGNNTDIVDAWTGKIIPNIRSVSFVHEAGEPPALILEVIKTNSFEKETERATLKEADIVGDFCEESACEITDAKELSWIRRFVITLKGLLK